MIYRAGGMEVSMSYFFLFKYDHNMPICLFYAFGDICWICPIFSFFYLYCHSHLLVVNTANIIFVIVKCERFKRLLNTNATI